MITAIINTVTPIRTQQTVGLQKPVMAKVKLYNYFKELPKEEKEWFRDHKKSYLTGVGIYEERKTKKLFLEEYNELLKTRAKREYEIAMIEYEKQMEIQEFLGFHSVTTTEKHEHDAHCNKIIYTYSFSRSITREEFILFLEKIGKEVFKNLNWWDDYILLHGGKEEWNYIHVKPYLSPL